MGVDGYAWLHRGAVGCAAALAIGAAPWAERGALPPYVEFLLKMVRLLAGAGAVPVVVFDGGRLPAKAGTNAERRRRRAVARERGRALLQQGREAEATAALAQCVDVTAEMVAEATAELRWV